MADATKLGIARFVLAGTTALTGGIWALVAFVNEQRARAATKPNPWPLPNGRPCRP